MPNLEDFPQALARIEADAVTIGNGDEHKVEQLFNTGQTPGEEIDGRSNWKNPGWIGYDPVVAAEVFCSSSPPPETYHFKTGPIPREPTNGDVERNQKRRGCKYVGTISPVRFVVTDISAVRVLSLEGVLLL